MDSKNRTYMSTGRERQGAFLIPSDLSEWVDKDLIRQWVLAEIDSLNWDHPQLLAYLQKHQGYHPRELFYLLAYAYLTSLFESEDIVLQSNREPALRQMLKNSSPSVKEIARFRKENRGLLRWALAQVLKRAVRERYGIGTLVPAGIRHRLEEDATERLEIARHMDRAAQGG